jgi:hypothetical protein
LIAVWPKSDNQRDLPPRAFSLIADFKHKSGRNGSCDTGVVTFPMFK